jgi:hypothetical protein
MAGVRSYFCIGGCFVIWLANLLWIIYTLVLSQPLGPGAAHCILELRQSEFSLSQGEQQHVQSNRV